MAVKIVKPALPDEYLVDNRVYTEERVFRQEQEKIFFASGILSAMKAKSSDLEITLRPCRLGSRLFVCRNSAGGRERAVSGTLAVMVGGTEDAFERARPVLSCIGKDLFHLGPSGTGNVVKLIVQMIYLPYVAAFCEGLALGENMGIAFDKVFSVLIKSSAGQPGFEKRHDHLNANDLTPRFEVDMAVKDLTLACELFAESKQPGHIAGAAREAYHRASNAGFGQSDLTAIRSALLKKS